MDFMLNCKSYINLFSLNEFQKSGKIIPEYFQKLETKNFFYEQILKKLRRKKSIPLKVVSIENLKTLEYKTFLIKHQSLLLFVVIVVVKDENIFKEIEFLEILKIIDSSKNMEEQQINT